MIKNSIKTAWRTIIRGPIQSTIVIGGLAVSLVVVLLILLWVQNEISYKAFHSQADRIFLLSEVDESNGDVSEELPYPIYKAAEFDIPEVEQAAVGFFGGRIIDMVFVVDGQQFYERELLFVDSNWPDLFDYRLLLGSFERFRDEPHVMAISESKAKNSLAMDRRLGRPSLSIVYPLRLWRYLRTCRQTPHSAKTS